MRASRQSGAAVDAPAHFSSHSSAGLSADDASARTATAHRSASCRTHRPGRAGTSDRPAAGPRTVGGHAAAGHAKPTPGSVVVRAGVTAAEA
ncbi:hypothetical protein GCM10023196_065460 [Actinoallomurus vinaceus]|uniref:Uncharacterized protein n=1 Tax=Actinoallomurus vinaceus TaxID=1080074 RepID=A0ABP8UIF0_9ACTN